MNARLRLSVACATALLATAAQAQSHLRAGLWEEQITVKSDNPQANAAMAQMQERLASMPPEQRAAIEKMMASHGIGAGGAPNAVRVCVTKEQIARGFSPDGNSGRCQRTNVVQSGNVTKFDFTCTSSHSDLSGHGQFTELSDSAFAVTSASDMVTKTSSMHTQTDVAGRFVASDCGDVKPAEMPSAH
jgi:hypothetical protein